ncbi:MAG: hypothetical protein CFE26_08600 [Verrucomicrobiales bacterium VVV1]|nr:MAG: hypothetical protein CFE26_08600 [Verrucomicrobiales bacterium VVV1]
MIIAFLGSLGTPELALILFVGIIVALVGVLPFWFICKKAGFSPWLSLIMMVPFGALILPIMLAVMEWPSVKKPS